MKKTKLLLTIIFVVIGVLFALLINETDNGDKKGYNIPEKEEETTEEEPKTINPIKTRTIIEKSDKVFKPDTSEIMEMLSSGPNSTGEEDGGQTNQKEIIDLINLEREKLGLNKLIISDSILPIVTYKVNKMNEEGYFSHISKDGEKLDDIVKKFSYKPEHYGEILGKNGSGAELVAAWMDSPTHRKEIVKEWYNKINCAFSGIYSACHFSN